MHCHSKISVSQPNALSTKGQGHVLTCHIEGKGDSFNVTISIVTTLLEGDLMLCCRSASSGNLQTSAREPLVADPSCKSSDRSKLYDEERVLQLVASGPSSDSLEQLKDSLTPLLAGLRRTGKLAAVQASFKDATLQRTKGLVR